MTYWLILLLVLSLQFVLGHITLISHSPCWIAWVFPLISVIIIHYLCLDEPGGFRMIALILVLLLGMKIVTVRYEADQSLTWWQWFLFCFGWIGMRSKVVRDQRQEALSMKSTFWSGLKYLSHGVLILAFLLVFLKQGFDPYSSLIAYYISSLALLTALSLVLHYGLLKINTAVFRFNGYPAYDLFRNPWSSDSLGAFWGKRWNLAFSEMTSLVCYRPLRSKFRKSMAIMASFLLSGLLHEVALTLSVQANYGLPMLYFLIQGLLVILEPVLFRNSKPGIIWIVAGLLIPLPLLFHQEVMQTILWPILL